MNHLSAKSPHGITIAKGKLFSLLLCLSRSEEGTVRREVQCRGGVPHYMYPTSWHSSNSASHTCDHRFRLCPAPMRWVLAPRASLRSPARLDDQMACTPIETQAIDAHPCMRARVPSGVVVGSVRPQRVRSTDDNITCVRRRQASKSSFLS